METFFVTKVSIPFFHRFYRVLTAIHRNFLPYLYELTG